MTDIKIIKIIEFYDKLYRKQKGQGSIEEVQKAVKNFAKEYIDMPVTMLPVI